MIDKTNPNIKTYGAILKILKAIIWAVIVVPIFEPIMTPKLFLSPINPASARETSMMATAVLDCIIEVTPIPASTPFVVEFVNFSKRFLNLFPKSLSVSFENSLTDKRKTIIVMINIKIM